MAALLVAQQIAAAALVQIMAGKLEAGPEVVQRLQHLQPALGRQAHGPVRRRGQIGEGPRLGPADAAADLVQLGQAEHVSLVHDQCVGRRNIKSGLNNRGRQQQVVAAVVEGAHHIFQLGR